MTKPLCRYRRLLRLLRAYHHEPNPYRRVRIGVLILRMQ